MFPSEMRYRIPVKISFPGAGELRDLKCFGYVNVAFSIKCYPGKNLNKYFTKDFRQRQLSDQYVHEFILKQIAVICKLILLCACLCEVVSYILLTSCWLLN